jgi:hypothetical protein
MELVHKCKHIITMPLEEVELEQVHSKIGPDSSVGVTTGYSTDGLGIESR